MTNFYVDVSVLYTPAEGSALDELDQTAHVAVVDLSSSTVLGVARVEAFHSVYVENGELTRERIIGLVAAEPDFALLGEYEGALIYGYDNVEVALRYRDVGLVASDSFLAGNASVAGAINRTLALPGFPTTEADEEQFEFQCDDFDHGGPHDHEGPASDEGDQCPTEGCHGTLHQKKG